MSLTGDPGGMMPGLDATQAGSSKSSCRSRICEYSAYVTLTQLIARPSVRYVPFAHLPTMLPNGDSGTDYRDGAWVVAG